MYAEPPVPLLGQFEYLVSPSPSKHDSSLNLTCHTLIPPHGETLLAGNSMFRSRRFHLLCGAVAWSTAAADIVFCILDAASLSTGNVSFVGLGVAASAIDAIALCCIGLFSAQYIWKKEGIITSSTIRRKVLGGLCTVISVFALTVSLALVVTIKRRLQEVTAATSGAIISHWNSYSSAQVVIWITNSLAQVILYSIPFWDTSRKEVIRPVPHSGPRDSVMSEVRHSIQTANLYMLEPAQPSSPLAALPSPTFSSRSSQSKKSFRDSLQQVVRPVTSRTKLINRPSLSRDSRSIYSDRQSMENASQSDGFEAWDNSNIDPQAREAVMQLAPSRGTVLAPIPGSRPASPARALNGPFPQSDDLESRPLSPPPKMMLDTSRPPSPVVSEAHIHPLFRTESPTPAPATSVGTVITASPLATQMIPVPPRPYSRMRSNSTRAGSPSPLVHAKSFQSERSPSPPSREMTPPIPDFVLNSSPRSSTSGSTRRKTNKSALYSSP